LFGNKDYGEKVYKIMAFREASMCTFGFCYTANNSECQFKETLSMNLRGAKILWPETVDSKVELNLAPKTDHVVIFKQTGDGCSFGYATKIHPRVKSEQELLKETQTKPEKP
jgi:hypothetical protein